MMSRTLCVLSAKSLSKEEKTNRKIKRRFQKQRIKQIKYKLQPESIPFANSSTNPIVTVSACIIRDSEIKSNKVYRVKTTNKSF